MQMKIFITGSAGFLGSNLANQLLEKGYYVIAYDNLSMGKIENIDYLLSNPRFSFIKGDVKDLPTLQSASLGADLIVHLAAYKIPRYGNALETLLTNSIGTKNVLDIAITNKTKVVFGSTSDVYGKNSSIPFREDSDCLLGPSTVRRWSYAVSKLFDEHLCYAYQESYDLPVTILRFFGSYGPQQHLTWWGGPQSVFIDAILKGKPVEIHGDGLQTRTFTYVSDTVNGIVAAMECDQSKGEIFNIGSSGEISILGLANLIKRLSGTAGELDYKLVPYSTFGNYEDVRRRIPDTSKARRILDFDAKVSLEEGLSQTIQWQREVTEIRN